MSLVSSGPRPGLLLNILQLISQPLRQNYLDQNVSSGRADKACPNLKIMELTPRWEKWLDKVGSDLDLGPHLRQLTGDQAFS